MTDRYSEDIIRIVGTDQAKGGLDAAPVKDAIAGKRGIGYAPQGKAATGVTGSTGETTAPENTSGTTGDIYRCSGYTRY